MNVFTVGPMTAFCDILTECEEKMWYSVTRTRFTSSTTFIIVSYPKWNL